MTYFYRILPKIGADFPSLTSLPLLKSVTDEAEFIMKAPRDLIFQSELAAIAITCQGIYDVLKPTGQITPTSLMLLTIADSGERKTSVGNFFLDPIREFQREMDIAFAEELRAWEVKKIIWEMKNKEIFRCIVKSTREEESSLFWEEEAIEHAKLKPMRPRRFKMIYDDTTSEALMFGMFQNIPSAALISTEANLNNKAFRDLPKMNSLWGADPITVDRKTAESFELHDARLTVAFMTQPAAFGSFVSHNGEILRGSGLWARFLVGKPSSTQGYRELDCSTVSLEHSKKFNERIKALLELNVDVLKKGKRTRQTISFSPEAADLWVQMFNEIEAGIRVGGRFEGAGDMASKLADNISRVAALVHIFEGESETISLASLRFAIDYCTWCSDEFYRIFMPLPEVEVNAAKLLRYLKDERQAGCRELKKNDILIYGPKCVRKRDWLNPALDVLISAGYVSVFKSHKTSFVDISGLGYGF